LTLGELIRLKADKAGRAHLALIQPNDEAAGFKALTYKGFNEKVNQLANFLSSKGIKKSDRVAILLHNCIEFVVSYFAIVKIGAIALPLNTMLTFEELDLILQDAKAVGLITSGLFKETADELFTRVDSLKFLWMEENLEGECFKEGDASEPSCKCEDDDVATLIYTSGTTGSPKGVMLTHNNLISNAQACLKRVKITPKDRFSCLLLLYHSFTITTCVLVPFCAGATSVIIKSLKNFKHVLRQLLICKVSVLIAIPPIYRILAEAKTPFFLTAFPFKFLNPIRLCVSGGDALSPVIMQKFEKKFRIPIVEGYGLTEASPVVSLSPIRGKRTGSVGQPLEGIEIRIVPACSDEEEAVGDENNKELPTGEVGEILVRASSVMKGYHDRPEETKAAIKHGWLYTGDLGKLDEQGFLYIVDRKKDLIVMKGLNVYPKEVEDALYSHPKIKEAAVVGRHLEDGDEVPIAYVVLQEGENITEEEIHKYLQHSLAHYKIPRRIEFRKELPKTPTGKILKRFL
jgi:long-chain acyl-CoA synthetase